MGVVEATYAEIKQQELKKNPYSCLSTAAIDVNPHQVEAFTFSLAAMKLGGAVLADEVGLGKTIEAGLVLKYLLNSGSQKILLVMPSNLRKQWQVELDEKFEVESLIVESGNWDEYKSYVKNESAVVIVSYNFASRRKSEFAKVPWSFCVFDEAHRLRNVYKNGSKMAGNLYELTKGIPKLMLTATPMQNSLFDLYGLIQFIDERIFYSKAVFSDRYIKNEQYEDLRHQVNAVLQRTLRKEVSDYIQFPERKEMTVGLEFTATPKSTNKNIIFHYGLEEGAGKFLKIPVVMGRTNTAGYSDDDIEEMKLKDGIKLHERRKAIVYKYCIDNGLEQVKPIVLVACKDTTHAKKIKEKIDSDAFFGGRYVGKVIEIDSSTRGEETEENIQKLLTIEQNTNPVEIVLHVYKLKEGWDVNNLFTIIPLNAAKSDILALQTIGRGLRLPFGEITHVEEIDTLDIVAHDHYREIIDDIKDNPVFKKRNLDDEDIPETEAVKVEAVVQDQQISIFDDMFKDANVKSFQEIDTNKDIDNLYEAYQKAYVKKAAPKKKDSKPDGQITIFDLSWRFFQDISKRHCSAL